ncbi:MAG: protein kinase [Acidobacteria bacterium]|nr:protein kinase [Acidobacteriota bacterium]
MDPQRWQRIEELFHQVADLERATAAARLRTAVPDDPELVTEVLSMMDSDSEKGPHFQTAVAEAASALAEETLATRTERVGPYRLLREIGRGGMGAVFLAERDDEQYQKNVAVKLLPIALGLPSARERFLQERQILARLDHPYIAKLLDGGTSLRGEPYLIMDYIHGQRIDDYCEKAKLGIRARVELMRKVCEAVSCAHRNLIVHRDLKPANILVTEDGTPKLLDFGIAKLLAPEAADLTRSAASPGMTPEYASPEQVRGDAVTTATDIYALGATLYQLVTGRPPHQLESAAPMEIVRAVCEEPIPSPNVVRRPEWERVPDDLDRVILTALQKDPARRYSTVERLDDDLRRFLEGRAITAKSDSVSYRVGRFLQRHWLPVTAAVAMALTLAAAAAISIRKANEAEESLAQVRHLTEKFLFDFHDAIEKLPGSLPARKMVISTAVQYLDRLSERRNQDAILIQDVATAYEKVGDLQGNPFLQNLGDMTGALESYRKAVALRERLPRETSKDRARMALSYARVGDVFSGLGKPPDSEAAYGKALAVLPRDTSDDGELLAAQYRVNARRGDLLARSARMKESLASYELALAQYEKLHREDAAKPAIRSERAKLLRLIGRGWYLAQDYTKAQPVLEQAREELLALLKEFPDDAAYLRSLMLAHSQLAINNKHLARGPAAVEKEWLAAIVLGDRLAQRDPQSRQAQGDAGYVHTAAAENFVELKMWEQAARHAATGIGIYQKMLAEDSRNWMSRLNLATNYLTQGTVLRRTNKPAALESYAKAIAAQEQILSENPASRDGMLMLSNSLRERGTVLLSMKQLDAARADFSRSLAQVEKLKSIIGDTALHRQEIAELRKLIQQTGK